MKISVIIFQITLLWVPSIFFLRNRWYLTSLYRKKCITLGRVSYWEDCGLPPLGKKCLVQSFEAPHPTGPSPRLYSLGYMPYSSVFCDFVGFVKVKVVICFFQIKANIVKNHINEALLCYHSLSNHISLYKYLPNIFCIIMILMKNILISCPKTAVFANASPLENE